MRVLWSMLATSVATTTAPVCIGLPAGPTPAGREFASFIDPDGYVGSDYHSAVTDPDSCGKYAYRINFHYPNLDGDGDVCSMLPDGSVYNYMNWVGDSRGYF